MVAASLRAITFKSTAGSSKRLFLKTSLTQRLILFRVTAQPTFLLTVTPSRACVRVFACHTIRIPLEANFLTEFLKPRNSDRFRSLTVGGNAEMASTAPTVEELLYSNTDRQVFSTFCSSAFDNQTSIFGSHSHQKAMSSFSRNVAWLKCSFHVSYLCFLYSGKAFLLILPPSCQYIY